jgi:hypothetical protein
LRSQVNQPVSAILEPVSGRRKRKLEKPVLRLKERRSTARRPWRPSGTATELAFSEADLARAQLIRDLIQDLGVNHEGVGVILNLLDQMHGLRRALADVLQSVRERSAPAWYGLIDEPGSGPRMTICVEIRNISVRYRQPSPAPPPPNDHHGGRQTCKDRRRKSRVGAIGIVGPSSHSYRRTSTVESDNGARHREVVQLAKRVRLYSAAGRRRKRCVCAYLGCREGRPHQPE